MFTLFIDCVNIAVNIECKTVNKLKKAVKSMGNLSNVEFKYFLTGKFKNSGVMNVYSEDEETRKILKDEKIQGIIGDLLFGLDDAVSDNFDNHIDEVAILTDPYHVWMEKFLDYELAWGDLSRDIKADNDFPSTYEYEVARRHLIKENASDRVLEVFEETWERYTCS